MGFIIEEALQVFKNGDYLWKFQNCKDLFAIIECDNCGHRKAIFTGCGLRICPECAKRRGKRLFKRYLRIFSTLLEKLKCRLGFLTLTIRNCNDLKEGLQKLKEAWKRFKRRSYFRNRVYGGIFVIEVKIGRDGKYNLHAHVLILHDWFGLPKEQEVKHLTIPERVVSTKGIKSWRDLLKPQKGIGQLVLSLLWENVSGDFVVDIRSVRSPKKALRYLVKYILKPPEFPEPDHYVEFLEAFWKQPMLIPFGCVLDFDDGDEFKPICPLCGFSEFRFICVCLGWEIEEWFKPPPVECVDRG